MKCPGFFKPRETHGGAQGTMGGPNRPGHQERHTGCTGHDGRAKPAWAPRSAPRSGCPGRNSQMSVMNTQTDKQMAALVVLPAMPSSSSFLPFFFHVPNQGPDIFETNRQTESLTQTDPSFLET